MVLYPSNRETLNGTYVYKYSNTRNRHASRMSNQQIRKITQVTDYRADFYRQELVYSTCKFRNLRGLLDLKMKVINCTVPCAYSTVLTVPLQSFS